MKAEVILSLFVGIAASIGGAYYYLEKHDGGAGCACFKIAGPKSKMKQFGTSVAMYFADQENQHYPAPSAINFDPNIIPNPAQKTWNSLSINSKYFFFVDIGKKYTGKADAPLAISKKVNIEMGKHLIVYEDGHVSVLTPKETQDLIGTFVIKQALKNIQH